MVKELGITLDQWKERITMSKFLSKAWDVVLYVLAFMFTWSIFSFGLWVMDFEHPFLMLLGFIICGSAVLTFIALVMEVVGIAKDKFLNKS